MAKKTTQELETELKTLVANYNEAINVQQNCKTRIIAVQAVLEDRKEEEGSKWLRVANSIFPKTSDANSRNSMDFVPCFPVIWKFKDPNFGSLNFQITGKKGTKSMEFLEFASGVFGKIELATLSHLLEEGEKIGGFSRGWRFI